LIFTQTQALAWNPLFSLRNLKAPLEGDSKEKAPIALMEQLRADGNPVDAVGVWAAAVGAALDAPEKQGKWNELGAHLVKTALTPKARAWAEAFRAHLMSRAHAEGLQELLLATNQLWRLSDTFGSCPPPKGD